MSSIGSSFQEFLQVAHMEAAKQPLVVRLHHLVIHLMKMHV
jgi:hypothetical protein